MVSFLRGIQILATFLATLQSANAVPSGWSMRERFFGFRYAIAGPESNLSSDGSFQAELQALADRLSCFGWAQQAALSLHGEVRCNKRAGPQFGEEMRTAARRRGFGADAPWHRAVGTACQW